MSEKINLHTVQQLLFEFAESKGMTADEIYESWSVAYKHDLQETFDKELNDLFLGMDLFKRAMAVGDLQTAQSGLIHASIRADGISSDFEALKEDLRRAWRDFKWPEWPEPADDRGYQIPAHYNYKGMK